MANAALPIGVGLKIIALRGALAELKHWVDSEGVDSGGLGLVRRARAEAEALDDLVPAAGILCEERGSAMARHLSFVERNMTEGNPYPGDDAARLIDKDLPKAIKVICAAVPEPEEASWLRAALISLEDERTEFKEEVPKQARDLAHELAALAPRGGRLFLGVTDSGELKGLQLTDASTVDKYLLRLNGIVAMVRPPIRAMASALVFGDVVAVVVDVAPSGEPVHYVDYRPYLRDGSKSRPAEPAEVVRAVREVDWKRPSVQLGAAATAFFRSENGQQGIAFATIQVTNLGEFLPKVRASARFLGTGGPPAPAGTIPLRWSSAPEPLTMMWKGDGPVTLVDQAKVPASHTLDMAAGDREQIAVAAMFAGEEGAWGWTGESYLHQGRHPSWRLPQGEYVVEVTVLAGGKPNVARFSLDTASPLGGFRTIELEEAG